MDVIETGCEIMDSIQMTQNNVERQTFPYMVNMSLDSTEWDNFVTGCIKYNLFKEDLPLQT